MDINVDENSEILQKVEEVVNIDQSIANDTIISQHTIEEPKILVKSKQQPKTTVAVKTIIVEGSGGTAIGIADMKIENGHLFVNIQIPKSITI